MPHQPQRILGIASVLPVPGLCNENDVVAVYFSTLQKQYSSEVRLLRPQIDSNTLLARLSPKWKNYRQILRQGDYCLKDLPVSNLPWWGFRKIPALMALLSYTLPFKNRKRLATLVNFWKPDLVHAQYLLPDGLLALWLKKKFGIPYVLTVRHEKPVRDSWLAGLVWKKVLREAQAVTTVSAPVTGELAKVLAKRSSAGIVSSDSSGVSGSAIPQAAEFIPHGINAHDFTCEYRQAATEPLKLITVAQLISRKNLGLIMQALGEIKSRNQADSSQLPFHWTIIGRGPEEQTLRQMAKQLGLESCITWIDQVPHEKVYETMAQHHVFVMPSYPETFGRVYVEAMSCGLPVIAAKGSGIDGFLTHRKDAFFVQSIQDLTELLQELQETPQLVQEIGSAGQTLARKLFWDKIAERYWEIYQGVLNS